MNTTGVVIRTALTMVIVLAIAGLAAWYLFLRSTVSEIEATDAGRGLSDDIPSFTGSGGSTYQNVVTQMTSGQTQEVAASTSSAPRLWHVTQTPAAGIGFAKGNPEKLYFVERATGYIFSATPSDSEVLRLTNTLLPKTYDAIIVAPRVVFRTIGETGHLSSFSADIPFEPQLTSATNTTQTLKGAQLDDDIVRIVSSPDGKELAYTIFDSKAGPIGIRSQTDGRNQKRIFSTGIIGWDIQWPAPEKIVIVQNADDDIPGFAFQVGQNGRLEPILENIPGLSMISHPTKPTVLYSSSAGGAVSTYVVADRQAEAVRLPIRTIAEKCVFATRELDTAYCAVPESAGGAGFLQRWLMGQFHTTDAVWKVNTKEGTAELLFTPSEANASIDIERPVLHDGEQYLAFQDAKDRSVWILRLSK